MSVTTFQLFFSIIILILYFALTGLHLSKFFDSINILIASIPKQVNTSFLSDHNE